MSSNKSSSPHAVRVFSTGSKAVVNSSSAASSSDPTSCFGSAADPAVSSGSLSFNSSVLVAVVPDSFSGTNATSRSTGREFIDDIATNNSVNGNNALIEDEEDSPRSGSGRDKIKRPNLIECAVQGQVGDINDVNIDGHQPAQIPFEPDADDDCAEPDDALELDGNNDDESDYEYDYEDDDEGHFSGFLITDNLAYSTSTRSGALINEVPADTDAPEAIEDEESIEKEAETNALISGQTLLPAVAPKFLTNFPTDTEAITKPKWKEPSPQAVSMSLRAEREKTGGKRRLASDLYKAMMRDTAESGFSIEPKSEESMDKWALKLFAFDEDSNLQKDLLVLGLDHVELEMFFPDQYPFEPPFVRVVRPRFKRQTGFVMNGALCMELLTKDGWNPVNDIESVIVSIRSLLVVGDGRLQAACDMPERKREAILATAKGEVVSSFKRYDEEEEKEESCSEKRSRDEEQADIEGQSPLKKKLEENVPKSAAGQYSTAEARAAYSHLSDYHKKKGWDSTGWWAKKG